MQTPNTVNQIYGIVSLPGNSYNIISEKNLFTNIPEEIAPSNLAAMKYSAKLDFPGIVGMSVPANKYSKTTEENLYNNNPSEPYPSKKLFSKKVFKEYNYEDFPNAFRGSHMTNGYGDIPANVPRNLSDNEYNSQIAEMEANQINYEKSLNSFDSFPCVYRVFGGKKKMR